MHVTSHNIYTTIVQSTPMCGLRIFAGPPLYHLPGNVISATVSLVYINLQAEYELSSSTCFGQFQMFGKIGVGVPSSPATSRKNNFCTGSEFSFVATCTSDMTFLVPLILKISTVIPNWGPEPLLSVSLEDPEWHYWILRV